MTMSASLLVKYLFSCPACAQPLLVSNAIQPPVHQLYLADCSQLLAFFLQLLLACFFLLTQLCCLGSSKTSHLIKIMHERKGFSLLKPVALSFPELLSPSPLLDAFPTDRNIMETPSSQEYAHNLFSSQCLLSGSLFLGSLLHQFLLPLLLFVSTHTRVTRICVVCWA